MPQVNPIYCALDTASVDQAVDLARVVQPHVGGVKLGLEFFCAQGPVGVRALAEVGCPIFLDLKLHDIPNTVAGALTSVVPLAPRIITVHAQGGPAMMRAACAAADEVAKASGQPRPWIIAVTALTSLDQNDLAYMGISGSTASLVERLAGLAHDCGLDGVVCSAHEIAPLRRALPRDFKLVVPGIRPRGADAGDQKRVMSPEDALAAGADVLVIGRPITGAADPGGAAAAISQTLMPLNKVEA